MSDDCFFNPAACEEPKEDKPPREEGEMKEEMEEEETDIMPQITFLLTALGVTAFSGLDIFSRRLAIYSMQTDANGDSVEQLLDFAAENSLLAADGDYSTAYWTLGYQIGTWSMFVLGAAKFVFQALSMAGIMGSTNIMVWHYGMFIGDIVSMIVGLLWFMGYNTAYSMAVDEVADNDKAWTADAVTAITAAAAIESDMVYSSISQAAMHLELMANYEGWIKGQIAMLPEEERAAYEEKMEDDEDDMFTKFFRF